MKCKLYIKPHDCSMQKIEPVACHLPRVTRTSTLISLPDLLKGIGSSVSPLGFLLLESFTRSLGRDDGTCTRMEPTTFKGRVCRAPQQLPWFTDYSLSKLTTLMQSILAEFECWMGNSKPQSEIKRPIGPWRNETRTRLG